MSSINYLPTLASYTGGLFTNLGVRNFYQYFTTADLSQKGAFLTNGALKLAFAVAVYVVSVSTTKFAGFELVFKNLQILALTTAAFTTLSTMYTIAKKVTVPTMKKEDSRELYKESLTKLAFAISIIVGLQLTIDSKEEIAAKWLRIGEIGGSVLGAVMVIWGAKQILSGLDENDLRTQNFRLKDGLISFLIGGGSLALALGIKALGNDTAP